LSTHANYKDGGRIKKFEEVNEHNLKKYVVLSSDNADVYFHVPVKTLIYIVKAPQNNDLKGKNRKNYRDFYIDKKLSISKNFSGFPKSGVILNDFEQFISKTAHYIQSI
jgi:hypothetical protein